ncbi:uncharacterized protein PV07_11449 [Cladophialophora immunda]|uniref:FAD-binding domain-containing protein n=1 Tax=Cladophialophora immunda TaxID=569365 RepID=A0A0D2AEB6_9EURO|nr:uncharacterized protein PV07_11449 [Cladophialophora immunda]KIW23232.1 hypothetical protein PV07_11449 [Cladophialophora immunda]
MTSNFHVAIIGAGLAGLGMALALHAHSIRCTVYEQTPSAGRFAGAVMLAPNSLRILDRYGVYPQLCEQGFNFAVVEIRDSEGNVKDSGFYLGSRELFGYDALRVYRNAILKVLSAACAERQIEVVYGKRFSKVLSEDEGGVDFRFQDGTTAHADVLIAADGIHSKIRTLLFPQSNPEYNGVLVVCGAVKASSLQGAGAGHDEATTVAMLEGRNGVGAFLLGPQLPDASELLAGTQRAFPPQTREEWARLSADRDFHLAFLREGYGGRLPVVQSAVDNIVPGSTYIWPLQTLSRLERWWSSSSQNDDGGEGGGRVILIGDAAHAMPPTSGQGANQAFEDGWTLARVLHAVFNSAANAGSAGLRGASVGGKLCESLREWHRRRQERIDEILKLTQRMHNLRLPIEEQRRLNDGEVYKSLPRSQAQVERGADMDGAGEKAVVEQWGWLYCPEDLVNDLKMESQ